MAEPLTEQERKLIALALQGLAMRTGPGIFQMVEQVARKLGVWPELEFFLRDWIVYSRQQPPPGDEL